MLREGALIGDRDRRTEVQPFSEKQIELVTTFADQAVIAIEETLLAVPTNSPRRWSSKLRRAEYLGRRPPAPPTTDIQPAPVPAVAASAACVEGGSTQTHVI